MHLHTSFVALHHQALVLTDARRIAHDTARPGVTEPSIELLTAASTGTILDVQFVSSFYVATDRNGRGKRHDDGGEEIRHRDRCELRPLIRIRCL